MTMIQDIKNYLNPFLSTKNTEKSNASSGPDTDLATLNRTDAESDLSSGTDFSVSDFLKKIQDNLNQKDLAVDEAHTARLMAIKQSVQDRTHPLLAANPSDRLPHAQGVAQKMFQFFHGEKI